MEIKIDLNRVEQLRREREEFIKEFGELFQEEKEEKIVEVKQVDKETCNFYFEKMYDVYYNGRHIGRVEKIGKIWEASVITTIGMAVIVNGTWNNYPHKTRKAAVSCVIETYEQHHKDPEVKV